MNKIILKLKKNTSSVIACSILAIILLFITATNVNQTDFASLFSNVCVAVRAYVGILCIFFLIVLIGLSISKYGSIKLGGEKAKPEFSTFSWLSCLFMAGMGIGLLFYCQEPLFHMHSNPYVGRISGSPESIAYSLTLFNWTFNAWGLYAIFGLIIAFFHFNKGRDLKISSALPNSSHKFIKKAVDIVMALGIIAGLCTSLGLGVSQFKSGVKYLFNVEINEYIAMLVIGIIATLSVNSGLKRGVKWLSNINSILVCFIFIAIIVLAYINRSITGYIDYTASGLRTFFTNYVFFNDVFNPESDSWAAAWPVFYQMWYAAWAAFVSVFVAKISKGRTIRQFVIGVLLAPTAITILWFGMFGTIGSQLQDLIYPAMQNDISTSLFIFLNQISSGKLFIILSTLILIAICLFFTTSSDSSSYVVATLLTPDSQAYKLSKILWSFIQCIAAIVLFACGGLSLVQMASVTLGIIVITVMLFGTLHFLYTIKDYSKHHGADHD